MAANSLLFKVTFRDFQFLQGHMTRRVFTKNRKKYGPALLGVVLCAIFLAAIIVVSTNPYRVTTFLGAPYPYAYYLLVIVCLVAAILCLMPAIKLRLNMLRMQVSDDGPFLGATKLLIEPDGLVVDRTSIKSKYLWSAFQGVEIAKGAVILPVDNGIGVIIPATAFATDADRFEFAAHISQKLEGRIQHAP
jgi:YcxB-like protein